MVCTLIDNDNGHHTDQNVVDQRGTATPNHRRHCVTHWREQRCLYSYRELWVKWISARSGPFKVCGNECSYCIYISSYWNSLPSVIFWKFILSGICIELLRNFRGEHIFDANNITYWETIQESIPFDTKMFEFEVVTLRAVAFSRTPALHWPFAEFFRGEHIFDANNITY